MGITIRSPASCFIREGLLKAKAYVAPVFDLKASHNNLLFSLSASVCEFNVLVNGSNKNSMLPNFSSCLNLSPHLRLLFSFLDCLILLEFLL